MTNPAPHGTILSRELWPQLVRNSRAVVAAHVDGEECRTCIKPGDCGRLRSARFYLADPEMLRVEAEATAREARS